MERSGTICTWLKSISCSILQVITWWCIPLMRKINTSCQVSFKNKNVFSNITNSYIIGQEGTECITCIAVSASKKYLAVCERTNKALCTIYDINSQKKKKTLPDPDVECKDFQSREFLSACFNPKDENRYIVTLTGQPDWQLILWDWEKLKIITKINIGITGIPASINQKGADVEPEYNF